MSLRDFHWNDERQISPGSGYKSVGAFPLATPTTFLLFLLLAPVSASSFCVGSTDTFLGFPRVTRDEAIAMPGGERTELLTSL